MDEGLQDSYDVFAEYFDDESSWFHDDDLLHRSHRLRSDRGVGQIALELLEENEEILRSSGKSAERFD